MREIPLSRGFVALIDDCDFECVSRFKWHALVCPHVIYAQRCTRGYGSTLLHRFILGLTDPKIDVDHRDHNGLHNWRSNLRKATRAQNIANQRKRGGTTSQFRGVHWHKPLCKWVAGIRVNGHTKHLGICVGEVDAALLYDAAARALWGDFAACNFPLKMPGESVILTAPSVSRGKRDAT